MDLFNNIKTNIENAIFDEMIKSNQVLNKNEFRKFKKTSEFKKIYNQKLKLELKELKNTKTNKKILNSLEKLKEKNDNDLFELIKNQIIRDLSSCRIYFLNGKNIVKFRDNNIDEYRNLLDLNLFLTTTYIPYGSNNTFISIYNLYIENFKFFQIYLNKNLKEYVITNNLELITIEDYLNNLNFDINYIIDSLSKFFNTDKVCQILFRNQRYANLKKNYQINNIMLKEIPNDFTKLYPQARLLNRHFILHIGDTNTGKTYNAIQELKIAKSGTYLAPLRLLALEIQERLNEDGILCSMTTGEEEDIIPNAKHMSSTIEKLDINKYYDVCVIDEAQMIEDDDRGWAWTTAILGAYSERIHICMSENARDIVIKLIKLCNDTYEIVEHTRNIPLNFETKKFNFKNGIKKHDALIVFSRKKVLSVATELENMGIKASVIYGSLPYSVRKNEIRKFLDGETDIVVSTDAIGMGMNLPIKRIVFLESTKFDGKEIRYLKIPEVKQIAGRAGRIGMFEIGYVNSMVDSEYIKEILFQSYSSIQYARIQLPKSLLNLNMSLSDIMVNWSNIPDNGLFKKSEISQDLKLCKILENKTNLTKESMLDLISIPFDENNKDLENLWLDLIICFYNGRDILNDMDIPMAQNGDSLDELELKYKELDLYFSFCKTVGYNKDNFLSNIASLKEEISLAIMEQLKTKETYRTCKYCGRKIPWDYEYSMCNKCFKSKRYGFIF